MADALYLSLGSNQGDRKAAIMTALSLLDDFFGKPYDKLSSTIETPSWGFQGADFLNCVVKYSVDRDPFEILSECKRIERQLGRQGVPQYDALGNRVYHDRPIDIDIILYDNHEMDTPELTIPHPRMNEREFVTVPLGEIIER